MENFTNDLHYLSPHPPALQKNKKWKQNPMLKNSTKGHLN